MGNLFGNLVVRVPQAPTSLCESLLQFSNGETALDNVTRRVTRKPNRFHDPQSKAQERITARSSTPRFRRFVKVSRRLDVFGGIGENDNSLQRRRRSLSCWMLRNCASPESTLAFRAASTSPCHAGDSISSAFLESEAHSHSIV